MSNQLINKNEIDIRSAVRNRYGLIAEKSIRGGKENCCNNQPHSSCCGSSDIDANQINMISTLYDDPDVDELPSDVTDISLGCGDPVTLASLQSGQTVLDLGSGGGIDCFLAAKKVGPTGKVIGVDMTAAMIEKARKNKDKIGAENVEFRLGEIENLPVGDGIVDVIISNCVINLSPDKPQVFKEAFRVLKPGGKLAVSDIVTDGPLPDAIRESLNAWADCIAGALDISEYIKAIESAGFVNVEIVPSYWDQNIFNSEFQQAEPKVHFQNEENKHKKIVILKSEDGIETDEIKIEKGELGEDFNPQKAIFSAKIKAVKP
jgi:arsenite methyltransferase